MERLFNGHEEVLTHVLCNTPVFCPTHILAARLADAMQPIAPAEYLLRWEVTV
jgi:hypothetical protein